MDFDAMEIDGPSFLGNHDQSSPAATDARQPSNHHQPSPIAPLSSGRKRKHAEVEQAEKLRAPPPKLVPHILFVSEPTDPLDDYCYVRRVATKSVRTIYSTSINAVTSFVTFMTSAGKDLEVEAVQTGSEGNKRRAVVTTKSNNMSPLKFSAKLPGSFPIEPEKPINTTTSPLKNTAKLPGSYPTEPKKPETTNTSISPAAATTATTTATTSNQLETPPDSRPSSSHSDHELHAKKHDSPMAPESVHSAPPKKDGVRPFLTTTKKVKTNDVVPSAAITTEEKTTEKKNDVVPPAAIATENKTIDRKATDRKTPKKDFLRTRTAKVWKESNLDRKPSIKQPSPDKLIYFPEFKRALAKKISDEAIGSFAVDRTIQLKAWKKESDRRLAEAGLAKERVVRRIPIGALLKDRMSDAEKSAEKNRKRDEEIDHLVNKTKRSILFRQAKPFLHAGGREVWDDTQLSERFHRKVRPQYATKDALQAARLIKEKADEKRWKKEKEAAAAIEAEQKAKLQAEKEAQAAKLEAEQREIELQLQEEAAKQEAAIRDREEQERMAKALEESVNLRDPEYLIKQQQLVRPLDQEWSARVDNEMATKSRSHIITTTVDGTDLTRKDFGTLLPQAGTHDNPNGWLNDEIVNGWMSGIAARKADQAGYKKGGKTVPPYVAMSSAWYNNVKEKGISSIARWSRRKGIAGEKLLNCEKVYFPINTGAHWLILIISPKTRTMELLDSLGGNPSAYFKRGRDWLAMELGAKYIASEWTELQSRSNLQTNSNDCGVFTCFNALASAKGYPYNDIRAEDMDDARRLLAAVLVNRGFSGTYEL